MDFFYLEMLGDEILLRLAALLSFLPPYTGKKKKHLVPPGIEPRLRANQHDNRPDDKSTSMTLIDNDNIYGFLIEDKDQTTDV